MPVLSIQKAMMKRQLEAGIAVEMEHTDDPEEAKKIALDHLREDHEYYTKLAEAGLVDEPEAKFMLPVRMEKGSERSEGIRKSPVLVIEKSLTWSGYKLQGRTKIHGMYISIENKKGSVRRGVDKDGHEWATKMHFAYGYVRGTVGADKDHLDCYVGPNPESTKVFVVHQNDPVTGKYDEDKCMIGFDTAQEAKKAYMKQYDRPGFFGSMDETDIESFKKKVFSDEWKGRKVTF